MPQVVQAATRRVRQAVIWNEWRQSMKKSLALMMMALLSSGAWAGNAIFVDNPDTVGTILLDLGKDVGMGMKEAGEGDYYGTSLKEFGGHVNVGMSAPERGSTDLYGSILYDVIPDLPF
jgi:hypothetical protein